MYIRSNSWFADNLSWSTALTELGNAFEDLGHRFMPISTNGMNEKLFKRQNIMVQSIMDLERLKRTNIPIDLDLTFTIPQNFPSRFLSNSKHKAAIYAYEYRYWAPQWKRFYDLADLYFPPSNFGAEIFAINGIPEEKIFVVPHGVDTTKFNTNVPKYPLKTKKSFKFVSIVAPHSRKRINILLNAFCEAFDKNDDVCLVLKTKIYDKKDTKQAYEICVGKFIDELHKKYEDSMPEIEIVQERVDNVAAIYNACNVNISTTGSEAFYIPGIESMACGLINVVTGYGGHLDFMNKQNSLLIDYKLTMATKEDQYWNFDPRNKIAQANQIHTSEMMIKAYKEYKQLTMQFNESMKKTVELFSWKNAAKMMLDTCDGKINHYKKGTVEVPR